MRTIKFRGKKIDDGEWIEFCLFSTYGEEGGWCQCGTIGQFTGLYDRKGNEIFEGDIVKFTFHSDLAEHAHLEDRPEITENHVILFSDGSYWMKRIVVPDSLTAQLYGQRVVLESLWAHRVEVIGNIHDNPEMLKGGAQ